MKFIKKDHVLSIYYLVFLIALALRFVNQLRNGYSKEDYPISEFLINYQGGFVRRGLIGELLLQAYRYIHIDVYQTIIIISSLSFFLVIAFFLWKFIKNGYSLFILPFCIFLGNPIINEFWVRKDMLMMLVFFAAVYCTRGKKIKNIIGLNSALALGILIHESFAFFAYPMIGFILVYYSQKKNFIQSAALSILLLLPSLLVLAACCYFKGDSSIANIIWHSWDSVSFPIQDPTVQQASSTVAALGWSMQDAFDAIYYRIYGVIDVIYAPIAWIVILIATFYVAINSGKMNLRLFNYTPKQEVNRETMAGILIIQFLGFIPLFSFFSCDWGRLIFYWMISSYAIYLIIPQDTLQHAIPDFIGKCRNTILNFYDNIFGKSRSTIYLLCILIGFCMFGWSFSASCQNSSLAIVLRILTRWMA